MAILIYPFALKWGILGTSIVILLSTLIASVGFSYEVIRITKCELKNYLKVICLPSLSTIVMILIIFSIKENFTFIGYFGFMLLIGVGCISYMLMSYIFDVFLNYGIRNTIKINPVSR